MANSTNRSRNPLFHIAVIGVVVVAVIVGVFVLSGEDNPPDEPTVIAEDSIDAEPAGSGTLPEGEAIEGVGDGGGVYADENEEGITEQVDDVDPAPAEIDTVPATETVDSTGPDLEGETLADEQTANTVDDGVSGNESVVESDGIGPDAGPVGATTVEATQAGGANAEQEDEAERVLDSPDGLSASEELLLDEETIGSESAENVDMPGPKVSTEGGPLPDGRDAVTDLDPSECQDIVRDTDSEFYAGDSGGAAFIPTPSGPDANTRGECLDTQ